MSLSSFKAVQENVPVSKVEYAIELEKRRNGTYFCMQRYMAVEVSN